MTSAQTQPGLPYGGYVRNIYGHLRDAHARLPGWTGACAERAGKGVLESGTAKW
eukprot:CAMPEP_0176288410 /NCGR_PEP_ID=MMETSP0121_2-20121125/53957_1 /TAXON_ID=160619 /ORGANISM="Kryptoperidinium foliaceum, Strain CCMP 1326" /LENGTH=53 /DNA_ID=CAMNT_0017629097 /DNA_START=131 /DNA_END=289 /DNA_ORIENTATION=-